MRKLFTIAISSLVTCSACWAADDAVDQKSVDHKSRPAQSLMNGAPVGSKTSVDASTPNSAAPQPATPQAAPSQPAASQLAAPKTAQATQSPAPAPKADASTRDSGASAARVVQPGSVLNSVQEQIAKGDLLEDQDKHDAAIAAYRAALMTDPSSSLAHQKLAVAWLERGNADYAKVEDEAAIKLDHDNAAAYQHLGLSAGILQNFGLAASSEKQAIALKPDYQEAYAVLGKALSSGGNYDDAIIALNRAISLDPKDLDSYITLGAVYGRKSNYADAVKTYKRALEINPNSAIAHTGLGGAYGHLGDTKNQIAELKLAVQTGTNDPSTHGNLGSALTRAGDMDGAFKEGALANQLRIGRNWPSALNKFLLGWGCVFLLFGLIFGVMFAGSGFKPQGGEEIVNSFFLVFYKDRPGRFLVTSRRFLFIPEAFSRWFGATRVSIERDLIASLVMTKTSTGGIVSIQTADGTTIPFKMSNLVFTPLSKELHKFGYSENIENQTNTLQMKVEDLSTLPEQKK